MSRKAILSYTQESIYGKKKHQEKVKALNSGNFGKRTMLFQKPNYFYICIIRKQLETELYLYCHHHLSFAIVATYRFHLATAISRITVAIDWFITSQTKLKAFELK